MKQALRFSAALTLGFTSIAGAADLALSSPMVAPPAGFTWTGIYLGIGGGAGWGNREYNWNQDATLAAVWAQMANPGALPQVGTTQGSLPLSGRFFGGQLGGNWQVGWAVLGIQADAHWADINGRGSCFDAGALNTAGLSFACNDKITSFGSVTGRVGAAADRALIYAKGGWAWEHGQHRAAPTVPFDVMGMNDPLASITAVNASRSRTGWILGAGVEYAFAPQWSAFIEYNYLDFGTVDANSTHLLSLPSVPLSFVVPIQAEARERFNTIKVGLNYRLNGLSSSAFR
jgi:outer membrane immunogenic protein